jgi:hypothetical protein
MGVGSDKLKYLLRAKPPASGAVGRTVRANAVGDMAKAKAKARAKVGGAMWKSVRILWFCVGCCRGYLRIVECLGLVVLPACG